MKLYVDIGLSLKFKFPLFAFGLAKTLSIVENTPSVIDFELSILEVSHCLGRFHGKCRYVDCA